MFCFLLNWRKNSNDFKIPVWRSDSIKRNFGGFAFTLGTFELLNLKFFFFFWTLPHLFHNEMFIFKNQYYCALGFKTAKKGSFHDYVDQISTFYDHHLPIVDKRGHFRYHLPIVNVDNSKINLLSPPRYCT